MAAVKSRYSGNVYGAALARAGFVVIAFDASYQRANGGEPCFIADLGIG